MPWRNAPELGRDGACQSCSAFGLNFMLPFRNGEQERNCFDPLQRWLSNRAPRSGGPVSKHLPRGSEPQIRKTAEYGYG
jgi:hypothetical protein